MLFTVSSGSIRLVQGRKKYTQGYVEIFSDGKWKGVCNHNQMMPWAKSNSRVVCAQLDREAATAPANISTSYNGTTLDNKVFRCSGSEKRL